MSLIECATPRLEPLVAAHADEMFGPMSAAEIYDEGGCVFGVVPYGVASVH
jgi:hypothetical protein